jgi:ferric-dicitrate binding protein FerR (iron transport regulator)
LEHPKIDEIIFSYLRGEATAHQIEVLRAWINSDEKNLKTFESLREYWEQSHLQIDSERTAQFYEKLNATAEQRQIRDIRPVRRSAHVLIRVSRVAAVILFLITFAVIAYYFGSTTRMDEHETQTAMVVKENPKGQKLTTYLPDGSKVILNSDSKVAYSNPFAETERIVELSGEAFFDVKRDTAHPFRVVARGVTTTALGTSFGVHAREDGPLEVNLVSGRVEVRKALADPVVLDPGESAMVESDDRAIEVMEFDYMEKLGWKDGVLVFKNSTLPEIIPQLENWYGVDVQLDPGVKTDFHYSGNYRNESLEEVLNGLSFVLGFSYTIQGESVEIFRKNKP